MDKRHTNKRTKIVATIGPACDNTQTMKELMMAGVNVFRFNMKHNTIPWHEERIAMADKAANEIGVKLGILIDLQGPEIRIETRDEQSVKVNKDELITFGASLSDYNIMVCIPQPQVFEIVNVGDKLLIDDGFLEFLVVEKSETTISARARDNYVIKHRKGLNIPGKNIEVPSLISNDLEKLDMATRAKVDFVALSFCRSLTDVETLRAEMSKRKLVAAVVSKIESQQALDNIVEIVGASDAVMVARGDLGVEVAIEQLAYWQKKLITMCRKAGKPVIVATQMLQSMVENPRPTRAEATDVSNAVWDGTDAVMLSGETATGAYPVVAVEAMSDILEFNEKHAKIQAVEIPDDDNTQAVAAAAFQMVSENKKLPVKAIVVFTETGYTARTIAAYRPSVPIIAVTALSKTAEESSLSYGVFPFKTDFPDGKFEISDEIFGRLTDTGFLNTGDLVLVVHGTHWNKPRMTNSLALVTI